MVWRTTTTRGMNGPLVALLPIMRTTACLGAAQQVWQRVVSHVVSTRSERDRRSTMIGRFVMLTEQTQHLIRARQRLAAVHSATSVLLWTRPDVRNCQRTSTAASRWYGLLQSPL